MTKPNILVTAAAGKTGSATVHELLRLGFPVRALVHRDDQRAKRLRDAGATTIIGNMLSAQDMVAALNGIQRAYFVSPWTVNQLDMAMTFAIAAAENRVEHVVATTQWLASPLHPSMATRRSWMIDQMLDWLPDATRTLINVGFFADNYMALLEPIAHLGLFPMPLGDGLNAPVSNADIGRSIAGAIAYPELHAGKTYRPCGPELLDPHQIASTFSKVLRRRVRYMNISERMFVKATRSMGLPTGLISQLRIYFSEYRDGTFAAGAPNDAVLHLTGREPENFETIVRDYVQQDAGATGFMPSSSQLPSTRRSFVNTMRAMANFAKLLLTPAPNLDRYMHQHEYPMINGSKMSMKNEHWIVSHMEPGAFGSNQHPDLVDKPTGRLGAKVSAA